MMMTIDDVLQMFSPSSSTTVVIQIAIVITNSGQFTQVAKSSAKSSPSSSWPSLSSSSSKSSKLISARSQAATVAGSSVSLSGTVLTPPATSTATPKIVSNSRSLHSAPQPNLLHLSYDIFRSLGFETNLLPVNYEAGAEVEVVLPAGCFVK